MATDLESTSTNQRDRALMARVAGGDRAAFEELYRLHGPRTLREARKLCGSREQAEDLTQECFASLWRNASGYRAERGSPSAWLGGMLRNRAIDAWRRAAVRPIEVNGEGHEPLAGDVPIAGAIEHAPLRAQLAALPTEQRDVLFLAYFADLTHAQIAAWSGVSLGTVKGRARLGLRKLAAALGESAPVAAA